MRYVHPAGRARSVVRVTTTISVVPRNTMEKCPVCRRWPGGQGKGRLRLPEGPGGYPGLVLLVEKVIPGLWRGSESRLLLNQPGQVQADMSFCSSSQRSASSAAMQPAPAEVTACLYTWSVTSPAANTPGTLVMVASPSVPLLILM